MSTAHRTDRRWPAPCRTGARAAGFTLLELLVAIAIFAVMSVMAYGGLNAVMESREQTEIEAQRLGELQKALALIKRDLEQAVPRAIRDGFGDGRAALIGGGIESAAIEFTRTGWSNPTVDNRSDLQRVAYEVRDDTLLRHSWIVLDRAQDSQSFEAPVMHKVRRLELRFLDAQGEWQTSWPKSTAATATPTVDTSLPRAVEFTIETEELGAVKRLLPMAGTPAPGGAGGGGAGAGT